MHPSNLRSRVLAVALFAMFGTMPVHAGASREWAACSNDNAEPKAREAACTALLNRADGPSDMHALVLSNRGSALTDKGEIDKAIADFDAALSFQPDLAEAFNGRCWAKAVRGQKLDEALRDCNEAVRLAPRSADNLDSRGFVFLRLGLNDKAIADYTAALAIKPDEASSLYGRGLAQLRSGNKSAAETDFAQAKSADATIVDQFAAMSVKP